MSPKELNLLDYLVASFGGFDKIQSLFENDDNSANRKKESIFSLFKEGFSRNLKNNLVSIAGQLLELDVSVTEELRRISSPQELIRYTSTIFKEIPPSRWVNLIIVLGFKAMDYNIEPDHLFAAAQLAPLFNGLLYHQNKKSINNTFFALSLVAPQYYQTLLDRIRGKLRLQKTVPVN